MPIFLFLLFIAVPIAEIAIFIQAGQIIGIIPTILLTIGTAVAGSVLLRIKGFSTLNRLSASVQNGEMPVGAVLDGVAILAGGLLLLTPGLLTDAIGLLLFVPVFRRTVAKWLLNKAVSKSQAKFYAYASSQGDNRRDSTADAKHTSQNAGFHKSEDAIDAEFETIDPANDDEDGKTHRVEGANKSKHSPWRRR